MSTTEILAAIRALPPDERMALMETVLHMTREDLFVLPLSHEDDLEMVAAALALRIDYEHDPELTSFTLPR